MEYKGRIKFYDEEMDVQFPEDFNLCKKKIGEMIGLSEDELLNQINLYYKDEDGDKISITEDNDYKIFINFSKENGRQNDVLTLIIELKEKSEILVKKISQEMSIYKEKNSEEIKNEIEKDEDLMNQIVDEKLIIKNIKKNNEEDNNDKIPENNKIEEEINNNENENKNDMNPQNNNINQDNQDKDKIIYQEKCEYCKASPLYDVFYFCFKCDIKMCSKCELERGTKHSHPFLKIQTYDQYMNSLINFRGNVNNLFQNYGGAIGNFLGNLNNIISIKNRNDNSNNDNRNNNNNENKNDYKDLIQKMREEYDLNNIPNEKIEEVLIKSNGDINKAIEYLFDEI